MTGMYQNFRQAREKMQHLIRAATFLIALTTHCHAAGFTWATASDPKGDPLEVAIWYPSTAPASPMDVGPFHMMVARDGAVAGHHIPLIVLAHGTHGSGLNYFDTAIALADAGFVVAAVTHTHDNYRDFADAFTGRNFTNRPRHISRVIDYMLTGWTGHDRLDASKIGMLGHSAGGSTALIVLGARPDFRLLVSFCRAHPEDWGCQQARAAGVTEAGASVISAPDRRVKAAVLAAPALNVIFTKAALAGITAPVQLWAAARDGIVTDAALVGPALPHGADTHIIPNAGHFAFLAPCSQELRAIAPDICKDPDGFDRARFLTDFQAQTIAFFRARLR